MSFPILLSHKERLAHPDWPLNVPWDLVRPHEHQAYKNHGQTLSRLAERGGLSPLELIAVVEDHDFPWRARREDYEALTASAAERIKALTGVTP